jgi:hypothetical protein
MSGTDAKGVLVIQLAPFFGIHPIQQSLMKTLLDGGRDVTLVYQDYGDAEKNIPDHPSLTRVNISFYHGKNIFRLLGAAFQNYSRIWKLARKPGIKTIVPIEPLALIMLFLVFPPSARKIVYVSLEVIIEKELKKLLWKLYRRMERFCMHRVECIITQDHWRAELLSQENRVPVESVLPLPNSEIGQARIGRGTYFHDKLGLPPGSRVILHPGSPGMVHRMLDGIRQNISSIPDGWVLVFHIGRETDLDFNEEDLQGKVAFSTESVPAEQLPELYSSCDIGFAYYENFDSPVGGLNIDYMGHSSGKFNMFLMYGKPVVVSSQFTFGEIFAIRQCGEMLESLSGLGEAIGRIAEDYDRYCNNAVEYHNSYLDFSNYRQKLLDQV